MNLNHIQQEPPNKGLVFSARLTEDYSSGVVAQEETGNFTVTGSGGTGTPTPSYPGFSFVAASTQLLGITTGPTVVKTISYWVNQDDIAAIEAHMIFNVADWVFTDTAAVTVNGFAGGHTLYVDGVVGSSGSTTITANWHHIAVTYATGLDADAFNIGIVGANFLDGLLSQVRLYDIVLSDTEVSDIYRLQRHRYSI